ncbi:hypothetical protein BGI40_11300 [Snodgrassella communis]|uniref:Uncharacterized protein n=1 Tax=Snodgrassella communis TaxID=2946699 RepID=A0A836MNH1_9NEIS|nr:hypothetical protein [Snodgrassella communis]KDN13789.1 hypothetical protein SALWKB29_2180 [Snodgrassella communis]PIT09516.1 hypothetical protein BGI29_04130 [Snodgrassella communis]PIT25052.1 hypothetical protein BGI38_11250 [Snodgrassella communis]PIT30623.1 hypothetical protein BGI39_00020 [Snodgrassella communis]PIT30719.1 hypothetical protein BGI40_11300 [Snodgrassella communis]
MKYITVPVNTSAMKRLDYDDCVDGDLIELTLNEDNYADLLKSNVINQLNTELGINIDDYEDEKIINIDKLIIARNIIENSITSNKNEVLIQLLIQVDNAIKYKTGLFFYF